VSYNGAAGYYYWRVLSYSGSGAYSLYISAP
jgi:serine protease